MDLGRVKRIWIYFSVLRRKSLTSAQTHSSLVGLLRSDSSLRRTHDVRTLDQEVRQWTGCHWSLGSNSSVIHKRPSLLEEQTGQNGMYLHWGLGIRIVRIPNTEYRIVIRYPNKFFPNYLILWVSLSELERTVIHYPNKFYPNKGLDIRAGIKKLPKREKWLYLSL